MQQYQLLKMTVLFLLSILLVCITGVKTDTSCSSSSRARDLQTCLQKIRSACIDVSRFWFGSGYATRCTTQHWHPIDCFNRFPTPRSLVQTLFWPGTFHSQKIDRYLDLTFTSGPGEYTGCDHHYKETTTKVFTIDPLSKEAFEPWHLRIMPAMKWTSKNDEQYTLIMIDVGYRIVHAAFMNIPGNNISKATVLLPYTGPGNQRQVPNPYAFLLFKQTTKNMNVSQRLKEDLSSSRTSLFNISDFINQNRLDGPIAINWLLASYDPSSVEEATKMGLSQNCVPFVQRALKEHRRLFLPTSPNLKVYMRVSFQTPALTVKLCCKDYSYPARTVFVDPIGNGKVLPAEARTDATAKFELQMNKWYPNNTVDFAGKMYVLAMLDPDVALARSGSQRRPLVHMLVVNIKDGDVKTGEVLRSYIGPMPPDRNPHNYYFLLYEQKNSLKITEDQLKGYLAPNSERFHFDINTFTKNNSLTLVGATWMVVGNDEFVNSINAKNGRLNEAKFCTGKPGYAKPCPKGGASYTNVSLLLFNAALALSLKLLAKS